MNLLSCETVNYNLEAEMKKSILVKSDSDHHDDWCQALTRELDVEVFPKILRENKKFHEITAFFFPKKNNFSSYINERIKKIMQESKEISLLYFYEPPTKNVLLANFIVEHSARRTVTGFLNDTNNSGDHTFIENFMLNAESGTERWLFTSYVNVIDRLRSKIIQSQLGDIRDVSMRTSIELKIRTYERFFRYL